MFQQLSGKAAQTIYERLVNLIPKTSNLCPNEVLKLDKDEMRKAGLSFQKINYVRNLADYFEKNSFFLDFFFNHNNPVIFISFVHIPDKHH